MSRTKKEDQKDKGKIAISSYLRVRKHTNVTPKIPPHKIKPVASITPEQVDMYSLEPTRVK